MAELDDQQRGKLSDIISAKRNELRISRGKAIQSYANLEQAMCRMFGTLLPAEMDAAAVVFFKITSSGARVAILEKLFKRRYGNDYNLFFNSLIKKLNPINTDRNAIVHWNEVNETFYSSKESLSGEYVLKPPSYWTEPTNETRKSISDLEKFSKKCEFYAKLLYLFDEISRINAGPLLPDALKAWHEIFLQPIIYPPPANHPFFLRPPKPENPP